MDKAAQDDFLAGLPTFTDFEGVEDVSRYRALPGNWSLAVADVVDSTGAISKGKYKSVNMAGASVISAMLNALKGRELLFVFGGDGASVAIPPDGVEAARTALSAVVRWVGEELGIELRGAIVPVSEIEANGLEVRVARYQASPNVTYAMFAGGGASWAEAEMKAGRFRIEKAPEGSMPDLTGLSCRWSPIRARHDQIVSVIILPVQGSGSGVFATLVSDVLALLGTEDRNGHPIPSSGPSYGLALDGVEAEAKATPPQGSRMKARLSIFRDWLVVVILGVFNGRVGGFSSRDYLRDVALNTDFRKFDDGLKLTVDISASTKRGLVELLDKAVASGVCRYGIHSQNAALMTCIVPSAIERDHMHFVDGAAGGYAEAAKQLREPH
ncbi:DUF3095 domain-containing protein [Hoeflea sp.]|uniref:DUF3095 domain-containing protein n=1 Tax=Hoeflea sp. TaxID=1940281 RepID=UPI0037480BE4